MTKKLVGASVSEPLSSDLNVNFTCLSVCHGPSTYHKSTSSSYFARFASCINSKTTRELKTWTMDSLTPRWRRQGWRPPLDLPTRAIDITTWQFVDTICLCCLTHGVCVSHWTPTSSHNRAMEMARILSSVHAISMTCSACWTSLCACSKLVYYCQAWLTVPVYACT